MSYLQNFKYDIEGPEAGQKLVFLHGVMGSGANWRKITPYFREKYRVLTFDQRGHGWSFKPEKGYTPEDYSDDLLKIIDELGWDKIILVGHSMGGRNALQFAHSHPERLIALVVEDIGPEGNPVAMERTLKMVEGVPAPFLDKAAAKKYFETEFLEKMKNHPQKAILGPYLFTNIEGKPDGSADWRFNKAGILFSLRSGHFRPRWDQVRDVKVPTLFIRGQKSQDFTAEEMKKVLHLNPSIKGVEIADSGHWVHFDQPAEFIRVLEEFLISL
jgi:esterase